MKDDATTPESTGPDTRSEHDDAEHDDAEHDDAEHDDAEQAGPELPTYETRPEYAQPYSERLYAAWWMWLLPLAGAALLAASIRIGYSSLPVWLPYLVLLPLAVIAMLAIGRTRIAVTTSGQEPELHVGQARLPLRFVGSMEIIGRDRKQAVLGPEFDPAAFLTHRASVGPVLLLELTDPDDTTPYWVFSTRHPTRLAAALGADTSVPE